MKISILEEKLTSAFKVNFRITISGIQNYFQIPKTDWIEAVIVWVQKEKS